MAKRLTRSRKGGMFGGVAAGIAEYLNVDPLIVRIFFILGLIMWGWTLILYFVLIFIMPKSEKKKKNFEGSFATEPIPEPAPKTCVKENRRDGAKMIIAVSLILIGTLKFAEIFIPSMDFRFFFPVLLIIGGAALILRKTGKNEKDLNYDA